MLARPPARGAQPRAGGRATPSTFHSKPSDDAFKASAETPGHSRALGVERWGRVSISRSPRWSSSRRPRGRGVSGTHRRRTGGSRSVFRGWGDSRGLRCGSGGSGPGLPGARSQPASRGRPDGRGIAPGSISPRSGRSSSTGRAGLRQRRWCRRRVPPQRRQGRRSRRALGEPHGLAHPEPPACRAGSNHPSRAG